MHKAIDGVLPWQTLMEIAFCVLALTPVDFWAMTPTELVTMCSASQHFNNVPPKIYAMKRQELEELQQQFPDAIAR